MSDHTILMIIVAISVYSINDISRREATLARKMIYCIIPTLVIFFFYLFVSDGKRKWHILFIGYFSVAFWIWLDSITWKDIKNFFKKTQK